MDLQIVTVPISVRPWIVIRLPALTAASLSSFS